MCLVLTPTHSFKLISYLSLNSLRQQPCLQSCNFSGVWALDSFHIGASLIKPGVFFYWKWLRLYDSIISLLSLVWVCLALLEVSDWLYRFKHFSVQVLNDMMLGLWLSRHLEILLPLCDGVILGWTLSQWQEAWLLAFVGCIAMDHDIKWR